MEAIDILKSLLPVAGSVLGGPLGGAAASWFADKIGVPVGDVTGIVNAVSGMHPDERKALENEFAKWSIQEQNRMIEVSLRDVQDARAREVELAKAGVKDYRADIMFALAVAVVIAVFLAIWSAPELNEYIKGVATLILGRFLGYLDNIYNYQFGSTRTSQKKDDTIAQLTKGQ